MRFARRMDKLGVVASLEVLAKATQLEEEGKSIIHLEIGEPDFNTPDNIKEACKKAVDDNYTHYSPPAGFKKLRQAIAEYVTKERGFQVAPEEVIVTTGGKPIMYYALTLFAERGDEVLYPNPGYPVYESVINFNGAKAIPYPLRESENFSFKKDVFKSLITPRTKMIIINSPANPTGGILSKDDLETIAGIAIKNDLIVLSDEIYSRILYKGEFISLASLPGMKERTIILDGLSKTYAMTGWRLGWGIMNKDIAKAMNKLNGNIISCAPTMGQMAAVEALKGSQGPVDEMVSEFKVRRELLVNGLNKIPGFKCLLPEGAFYAFPNIKGTKKNSKELAEYLLYEAGVALLPGNAFGKYGEGYLRISYANSRENLEKAVAQIDKAISKLDI